MGGFNFKKRGLGAGWQLLILQWLIPMLALAASSAAVADVTLSKVFIQNVVGPGSVSTAIFTITNTGQTPVTGLEFTDTLPTVPGDVDIATPANAFTSCSEGTVTAPDGGGTIDFSGGNIGVGETCIVSVDVTASTPGVHTNPAIFLNYAELDGDPPASLPVDITVSTALPGFSKSFAPGNIPLGDKSTLTFTIDNTNNASPVGSLDFTDSLPAGMLVADPPRASTDCISTVLQDTTLTAVPGTSVVNLNADGSTILPGYEVLPAGATCTVTVDVVSTGIGVLDNISGDLLADFVSSGRASATLEVTATEIALRKAFTDDPVPPGGNVTLEFTIDNLNRGEAATDITFSDDLAAALPGLTFDSLLYNDCGGSVTGVGTSSVDFTGGTLAVASHCSIRLSLNVPAGATPGAYTNTTSNSSIEGNGISATLGGVLVVGNQASDNLYVEPTPLLTKEFLEAGTLNPDPVVNPGDEVVIRFSITNTSATSGATDLTFIDELTDGGPLTGFLPFPVSVDLPPIPDPPCGAGSSLALVFMDTDRQGLELTGGSLGPAPGAGASCSFDVTVTIPADMPPAVYLNTTEEITATVDGATRIGPPASDTLTVAAAPSLTKVFNDDPVAPGGTVTLEFTLSYPADASGDATDITFTDNLAAMVPALAGLTANLPPNPDPPCGLGSSLSGSAGDTLLTLMNGSLGPGGNCTFSVTLDVPAGAAPGSYTNTTSSVSATVEGVTATSSAASDALNVAGLSFTKEFLDDPVIAGDTTILRFTIENIHPTDDATITFFTDSLATALAGLSATGAPGVDTCGGTLSGTTSLLYVGGSVASGQTCSIEVEVLVPAGSADGSYLNVTSSLAATQGGGAVVIDPATDLLLVDSSRLQLTKSFTDDPVAPGDPVILEFILTNLDPAQAATDIGFTDDLDAALTGLTFDSELLNDCGAAVTGTGTSLITVAGASLGAGGSCTIRTSLMVPAVAGAGIYTNTTSDVTGAMSGFPIRGEAASDELEINQLLVFSKSFDGPTTATGTATLTFTITNPGPNTVVDLQFLDDLDAVVSGMIAVNLPSAPCGIGSSISGISFLTFTGGELQPLGGSCSFDVEVLMPVTATAGTYTNTTSDLLQSGLRVAEPATADIVIEPPPAFAKVFTPDTIFAGGTSTLTFSIDNDASALAASGLAFTDNLPVGLVITSPSVTSNTCGGTLTAVAGASTITLAGGSVGAGSSCTIDVDVTSSSGGTHVNATGDLTSSSGNSGIASDILTVNVAADLSVSKTDGVTSATPGGSVSYSIVVANAGPSTDPAVILNDTFASAPLACTWTSIAAGGATGNTAAGAADIAETLSMPAGSTVTYTTDCLIDTDASGTLVNTAFITPSITDTDPGNNSATDSDTFLVPEADLTISKSDGVTSAVPGQTTLVYTILASNAGPSDDPVVSVVDIFPSSLGCTWSSTAAGGAAGNTATGSGDIAETLFMPAGSSVTYTADCSIASDATGTLFNTATITGSVADPDTGNNSATDGDTVLDPEADLSVSKTNGVTAVTPGQSVTYTIVAANAGPSADASASVSDAFPAELSCSWTSAAAGGATGNTTTGSGDIEETLSMPVGSSVTYTADCALAADATGTLSNTATVNASVVDPDSGNNSATDIDVVNQSPGFLKEFLPDLITLGEASTLTFTIDNSGNSVDATALAFADNLPAGIQVANPPVTANSCGGSLSVISSGTVINFESGTVAANANCTIAVDVTGTLAGSHLNTTGELTSSLGNSGTASDTLTVNPQPGFTKEFAPDTIGIAQVSTLSFVIDNSGSSAAASALAFTDQLPVGVLVNTQPAATNTCGGTLTADEGAGVVSLADGLVGAGAICSISVDVTATDLGTLLNTTSELVSSLGNSVSARDTLNVIPTLTVAGAGAGSGSVTGPGIDCTVTGGLSSGDCSESVAVGTLITLTAVADPGSEPPVWGGCDNVYGSAGEICDITLGIDATVTVAFGTDDGDGVPGDIEDLVDDPDGTGNGDGNGDGTADRLQSHVTSLFDNTGTRLVTVANETGRYQQDSFNVLPAPTDAPPGVSFPVGLLEFRVTGLPVRGTVEMSVYVPGDIPVNAYYKPNKQGIWVNVAKDITTVGNKTLVTFDLTDGGQFDRDNMVDANILDPGAPAFEQLEATPVPTLNIWGLLLMSTLLGLMLLWHGRGRLN